VRDLLRAPRDLRYKTRCPIDRSPHAAPDDADLQTLSAQLGERLRAAHHMLVTAESCTGGWIAKA
jgi:hypothetical protein